MICPVNRADQKDKEKLLLTTLYLIKTDIRTVHLGRIPRVTPSRTISWSSLCRSNRNPYHLILCIRQCLRRGTSLRQLRTMSSSSPFQKEFSVTTSLNHLRSKRSISRKWRLWSQFLFLRRLTRRTRGRASLISKGHSHPTICWLDWATLLLLKKMRRLIHKFLRCIIITASQFRIMTITIKTIILSLETITQRHQCCMSSHMFLLNTCPWPRFWSIVPCWPSQMTEGMNLTSKLKVSSHIVWCLSWVALNFNVRASWKD